MWVLLYWYQYTECKQAEIEQRVGNSAADMYLLRDYKFVYQAVLTLKVTLNLETSSFFTKTVLLDAKSRRSVCKSEFQ